MYTGEFEMIGEFSVADHIQQTHFRFKKNTDYEIYNNALDQGYDSEDAILNGYIFKLDTPQFNFFKDLNMEMVVILNMKLLNIDVIIVSYQQKLIVLSNAIFF